MPFGKGATGTGFQIFLKGEYFCPILEADLDNDFPGAAR